MSTAQHGEGASHSMIRRYLLQPATLLLAVMLGVRGSYVWTNHVVNLFVVPVLGGVLLVLTGFAISVMCEMLMVEGGRDYIKYRRMIAATERRKDLKPAQIRATVAELAGARLVANIFMWVGLGASLFSGVWFLIGFGKLDLQAGLIDALVSIIATLAILFFLALRQEEIIDPLQHMEAIGNAALVELAEKAKEQLATALAGAGGNEVLAATVFRSLGADMRTRYAPVLALLSPPKADIIYWTMTQVYEYAGARGDESRKRQVRRIISKEEANCALDADGGRIVPEDVARRVLGPMHDEYMLDGGGAIRLQA